jgi:hypothetical protein
LQFVAPIRAFLCGEHRFAVEAAHRVSAADVPVVDEEARVVSPSGLSRPMLTLLCHLPVAFVPELSTDATKLQGFVRFTK